jgi:pyridoxine 5-phosphate synthase
MSKLSVNVNKIATLRNARGGNIPDVQKTAKSCEVFGADGITVHPRPDERHIRYSDVLLLGAQRETEFNVEGFPGEEFLQLVEKVKPEQVTLVPDPPNVLTSNAGWKVSENKQFLKEVVNRLTSQGMRVSLFMDPEPDEIQLVPETGAQRIELYTEAYAANFAKNKEQAIEAYVRAAELAQKLQLGLNAGHDLNLSNLRYFAQNIPNLLEVSIGHALISDALYFGLENSIKMYKHLLKK